MSIKLIPLKIPDSTSNLKDFFEFCKTYKNYKEYQEFFTKQINDRQKDIDKYARNILSEYFHKTLKDWVKILNQKDIETLKKLFVSDYMDQKNKDFLFQKYLKENKYHYLRCHVTNNFYDLSLRGTKFYKDINYEILDNKINIIEYRYGGGLEATCYSNGYEKSIKIIYEINLIDFSIKVEKEETKTTTYWHGFKK